MLLSFCASPLIGSIFLLCVLLSVSFSLTEFPVCSHLLNLSSVDSHFFNLSHPVVLVYGTFSLIGSSTELFPSLLVLINELFSPLGFHF
jgi:hypothetical protein